ncbi:PHP domain-containing protein [Gracilibacillus sp. JCM 18860]|uniref:PHP domain-containing protein n=1 Tax=Gracilibacillus sp. JCM 18860 TaxID=1306159 RepID=UPI0006D0BA02
MIIDLHIHSTFSDGELTPEQIVATAVRKEITIISITDHDEMAGYVKARKNAPANLHVIPGRRGGRWRITYTRLLYKPDCEALIRHIAWRKEERKQWAQDIIEKLNQLGYAVSLKECLQKATGDIIVRTHIADVLVEKSYFHTSKQAHEKLLKKGADAFVPRAPFTAIQAIDLIHEACGQAFLAHPGIYPEIPPIKN